MKHWIIIIIAFLILSEDIYAQNRWTNNYLSGEDPFAIDVVESYDKGYLLYGKYGPNYSSFNWLIKTDINGEILWNKTIGTENSVISFGEIAISSHGQCYLAGSTYYYGVDNPDPMIMKLDSCGEKEWCKIFIEDGNNFSNALEITSDGGVVCVLRYMNPDISKDRICIAKLSSEGELIFKKCYNSTDTSIYNEDAKDITICSDNGFLITGLCYYEDPNPPHYLWAKPYFIKTDSLGNLEWEAVIHKDSNNLGGMAWSTVISPDSNFFYSSISHFYDNQTLNAPALVKMDNSGNVIDIYDLNPPNDYGTLYQAKFISDSTLMASANK